MIILDKDSYFKFSGGEVHFKSKGWISEPDGTIRIRMNDYSMDGLMALAEYCEILYRHKVKVNVIYPYFPYARQDRVMNMDEPFSLRIFCKFLNSLNLASVTVFDPHSDVVSALVHDVRIIPQWDIAKKVIPLQFFTKPDLIFISPDAGAYKKVSKLMPDDSRIAIGVKVRDTKGQIVSTNVYSSVDLSGKSCIIIDDICDGGKTFIELAKVLKAKGADKVYLYITHGIFSKGINILVDAGIEHIYTTDSISRDYTSFELTVKELNYV